jgi:rubrerythrin
LALSCKDQAKQLSTQYYSRPNISALEIRNPETVIAEIIGPIGEILGPKVYSPKAQFYALLGTRPAESNYSFVTESMRKQCITNVLKDLVTAEKVARRQYDELIMFPEIKGFESDLLYIRNEEHEHEKILECIIQRLGNQPTPTQYIKGPTYTAAELRAQQKGILFTPKALGEIYETILDRFGEEEEKSVKNYEEFLVKVQQSNEALETALKKGTISEDGYNAVVYPLRSLQQKVNKHLNEERVHLDVVDALRAMFSNMKLGTVY